MKKSKIIVPALGLLLLSTAASVSGTVAWFTASTTATANISSFAVKKMDGNLDKVVMTPVVGTELSDPSDNTSAIVLKKTTGVTTAALTDASYDHVNSVTFTNNSNDPLNNAVCKLVGTDGTASEANWLGAHDTTNNVDIWYSVSWQMKFVFNQGAESVSTLRLYFDASSSTATVSSADATTDGKTQATSTGFRIFFGGANSTKLVWAPARTTLGTGDDKIRHLTGSTGSTSVVAYDDTTNGYNAIASVSTTVVGSGTITASNATTAPNDSINYLGDFSDGTGSDAGKKVLTVNCVAWFEGTDAGVVDDSKLQQVTSAMSFFTKIA